MLSLLRRLIVTLIFLGGVALLLALVAARLGPWHRPRPLEVLDMVALFASAPFLGVALAALVFRSRALGLLTAAALVFVAYQFGGQMLGVFSANDVAAAPAPADPSRLRVLTYNLRSPNHDPYHLVDYVRQVQPDIIVLQEATSGYVSVFGQVMQADYPFSVLTGTDTAHDGMATWSRYPLFDPKPIHLSTWSNSMHSVRLSTGRQELTLYAVHLANTIDDPTESLLTAWQRYYPEDRDQEIAGLAQLTNSQTGPFILAGDFNSVAGSRPYRTFPSTWHDVFAQVGRGFGNTFPAPLSEAQRNGRIRLPFPLIRIDYILTSADIRAVRAWTTEIPVSDHLATLADLDLPPAR